MVRLLGPQEIRELASHLDLSPTKKLGQNFLLDANTVRKIVAAADVRAGERVVEIGPDSAASPSASSRRVRR